MEIHLESDLESRLKEHAEQSGSTPDEFVAGLVEGYFEEVAQLREMVERRWEAYQSAETKPIDGEEAFRMLRERALERIRQQSKT
jgi:predicted DNA-binding protein